MTASSPRRIFYGWWISLVGLALTTTAFGVLYSFGVFFTTWLSEWSPSRAALSAVFSLCFLAYGLASVVMGLLSDRWGLRRTLALGGLIMGSGLLLTARLDSVGPLYITWGLMVGIGVGTSYSPAASAVSRWFIRHKGLAVGLVVAGLGLGTVVIPPLVERSMAAFGWRIAAAGLGVLVWLVFLAAALIFRRDPSDLGLKPLGASGETNGPGDGRNVNPGADPAFTMSQALADRAFWILFAVHGLWVIGMAMTMVHLVPHALVLGQSPGRAALMLSVIGAMSVIGRVALAVVTDRLGSKRSLITLLAFQAGTMVLLAGAGGAGSLWLFTLLYGFSYGGLAAIFPLATSEYFGLKAMGSIFGMILLGATMGGTVGPVLAGYIFDLAGGYRPAFLCGAASMALGAVLPLLMPAPGLRSRTRE